MNNTRKSNIKYFFIFMLCIILSIRNLSGYFESPVKNAEKALSAGKYEEAARLYLSQPYSDEIKENLDLALDGWAAQLTENKETEKVTELLDQIEDEELKESCFMEMAANMLKQDRYDLAKIFYARAGAEDAYTINMEQLLDQKIKDEDYAGSIKVLENIPKTAEREQLIKDLWKDYAEEQASQVIASDKDSTSVNYDFARSLGEKLDNVDAQLLFCHRLEDHGYSMKELYPSGVKIKIDLSA
ncbi:MAG: hypothetical protein IKE03_07615, partial [Blautia sp.]|nr:hypothetical protein [Blautia sp.]